MKIGNHEGSANLFRTFFPFPYLSDSASFWSWDYGPLHITVVDEFADFVNGSTQLRWIEADLRSTAGS